MVSLWKDEDRPARQRRSALHLGCGGLQAPFIPSVASETVGSAAFPLHCSPLVTVGVARKLIDSAGKREQLRVAVFTVVRVRTDIVETVRFLSCCDAPLLL